MLQQLLVLFDKQLVFVILLKFGIEFVLVFKQPIVLFNKRLVFVLLLKLQLQLFVFLQFRERFVLQLLKLQFFEQRISIIL